MFAIKAYNSKVIDTGILSSIEYINALVVLISSLDGVKRIKSFIISRAVCIAKVMAVIIEVLDFNLSIIDIIESYIDSMIERVGSKLIESEI